MRGACLLLRPLGQWMLRLGARCLFSDYSWLGKADRGDTSVCSGASLRGGADRFLLLSEQLLNNTLVPATTNVD